MTSSEVQSIHDMYGRRNIERMAYDLRQHCSPPRKRDLPVVLRKLRERLGVKQLKRGTELKAAIWNEVERQRSLRASRHRLRWNDRLDGDFECVFEGWRNGQIKRHIAVGLEGYRTARGRRASNIVRIEYVQPGESVSVAVAREPVWDNGWGGSPFPVYHDWEWSFRIRRTYRIDVLKKLGVSKVEGRLVLDVVRPLRMPTPEQAFEVLIMTQGRGASVGVEERAIYRKGPEYQWRVTTVMPPTWHERVEGLPPTVRRPRGFRSAQKGAT